MPGGGVALIRALQKIKDLEGANYDQDVGIARSPSHGRAAAPDQPMPETNRP